MAKKKSKWPTLDLHGKTTADVPDLVDKFLTRNQNKTRVCIIPGRGTGAVKKAVIDYLKLGGFPWDYETMDNGSKNPGSLIVFLD